MCKVVTLVIGIQINYDTLKVTPFMSLDQLYKEEFNDLHQNSQ
jgi:hypothetical protein